PRLPPAAHAAGRVRTLAPASRGVARRLGIHLGDAGGRGPLRALRAAPRARRAEDAARTEPLRLERAGAVLPAAALAGADVARLHRGRGRGRAAGAGGLGRARIRTVRFASRAARGGRAA